MKKYILVILVAILLLVGCGIIFKHLWAIAVITPADQFTRTTLVTVSTQIALSLFTLVALLVSLWVAGLDKVFKGPKLSLKSSFDELHCVLSTNPVQDGILNIYIHVENERSMSAEDCSVTCNEINVSVDGINFYKYKTIQTASFKWAYAKKEEPYVTTVRHTVEKYARIVEIRQQSQNDIPSENQTSSSEVGTCGENNQRSIGDVISEKNKISWFEVLLPMTSESVETITIPTRYRALLLPLAVVSKNTSEKLFYVKIAWNGDLIERYEQAGFLQIEVIDPHVARKIIKA